MYAVKLVCLPQWDLEIFKSLAAYMYDLWRILLTFLLRVIQAQKDSSFID